MTNDPVQRVGDPAGTSGGSVPLPAAISRGLGAVRRRRGVTVVFTGVTYLVATALGYHVVSFVLDRTLDLPLPFRAVLLGGVALGLAWTLLRGLLAPARRAFGMSDDRAALLVERVFGLDDVLISAVQLARAPAPDRHVVRSSPLVRRVVADAAQRIAGLDLGGAVRRARLLRGLGLTLAAAVVVGVLVRSRPLEAGIWWERNVLLQETPWPREVDLVARVSPARRVVALGDEVEVTVRVLRGKPRRVTLEVEGRRTGRQHEHSMAKHGELYRQVVENVSEPLRLRVRGGDFRGAWIQVEVRSRPKLSSLALWVSYPAYTGLASTPDDAPLGDGNLKVPVGSEVRFRLQATEPLREATLTYEEEGALRGPGGEPLGRPAALAVDDRSLEGRFQVARSTRYGVALVSRDGFASGVTAQFRIRAVPDRLPRVEVVRPGRNQDVAPKAVVPMEIGFQDDYGLTGAVLVYQVQRSGERKRGDEVRLRLTGVPAGDEDESGGREAQAELQLEVEGLGAIPGDTVHYWFEAVDTRVASGRVGDVVAKLRGRSRGTYQLKVRSSADLERMFQGRLKRIREELAHLERAERALMEEIQAVVKAAGAAPLAAEARRRLTYAELDQKKIGQRLGRARGKLEAVRDEMEWNRVAKKEDLAWLSELIALAGEIVEEPAAGAEASVGVLRRAERLDPAAVRSALDAQGAVADGVRELVRRLDKWDLFNEVVRELRDLIEAQSKVRIRTKATMTGGSPR